MSVHHLTFPLLTMVLSAVLLMPASGRGEEADGRYRWLPASHDLEGVGDRVALPRGWVRDTVEPGSFASWLRDLPLKPGRPEVVLHDGRPKGRQDVHAAVVEIDVGERDLQQCADAAIRLWAEYLFSVGRTSEIQFDFTSGDEARYERYRDGWRASVKDNDVSWHRTSPADAGYGTFRDYLDLVFTYAGTYSLRRELVPVDDPTDIRAGDMFIEGGFPGHAVMVVDVGRHAETGEVAFLLVQSYMPAQEIHVLRGHDDELGPWYRAKSRGPLITPEWSFRHTDLRRFRPTSCEAANPPAAEGAAGT